METCAAEAPPRHAFLRERADERHMPTSPAGAVVFVEADCFCCNVVRQSRRFLMSEFEPEVGRHPVGTLAIVGVYGVLFAVGWFVVYVYVYLSRGAVTP